MRDRPVAYAAAALSPFIPAKAGVSWLWVHSTREKGNCKAGKAMLYGYTAAQLLCFSDMRGGVS
ncbi:hypothetical protein, partial [Bradyrhizobium sp.]|uniref:hypothetical protein n=1 Tax=Bradyrhizobium sp. TaxID=376 RepID=UPI003C4E8D42